VPVRILREGFEYLNPSDPVGIGATGGGVPVADDGVRPDPWIPKPWGGRENLPSSEAMELMSIPAEQLAATPPPVPYVLFPEEYGYDDTPLTIMEVLDIDRWAPQQRSWVSPTIKPLRTQQEGGSYSGSGRNDMGAGSGGYR
jgi:hypothetical protein